MLSRRAKFVFWTAIAAVLALGLGQVVAVPTQPSTIAASPVIIAEFAASNGGELADEDGDYADWIELHNRSSSAVNLEGWTLTDDATQPDKWSFRPLTLGGGERLVVFASGKNRRSINPEEGRLSPHTSFRLNADGGFLGLYGPTSRRYLDASEYHYPPQQPGVTYGVLPSEPVAGESMRYFDHPTPGSENDAGAAWSGLLEPVDSSQPHGVYTEPLVVSLSHPDPLAEIRFTTDGTVPSANSALYSESLHIDVTTPLRAAAFRDDMHPSPVTTRTYVLVDDVLEQDDSPAGFPSTWGTHSIDFGGYAANTPVQADYAMDPDVVAEGSGKPVASALQALPSLSLVMDRAHFGELYSNPRERGAEWERPVSVELIYPSGEQEGFQVDAGLRTQGGAGRWEFMPKHPFRLFFKQQYGASKLDYELFPGSPVTAFDTLVLRAGVDRAFAGHPSAPDLAVDHREATYLRDEWARASQIAMSGSGSHGIFVHLYVNGVYWGLYNAVERPDASFSAHYLGGDKDDWFSANHGGAVSGQPDRFNVLLDLASQGGLDDDERYATMLEFIDPEHFSDYLIVNWYAGNRDWPENNWYANVENPAGRNRFYVWDAEGTWDDGAAIVLGSDGETEGAPYPNVVKLVFDALIQNADFRITFADRLYKHTHGDGALTDKNAKALWMALADSVEPAIVAESARWGDVRYDEPVTVDDWRRARDDVLAQMEGNADRLIALARDAGYYPTVDAPIFSQQGGEFEGTLSLEMHSAPPSGDHEIYYTVDGTDPRQPVTGKPSGTLYTRPIQVDAATTVKARILLNGEWSALNEAQFRLPGQRSDVRVTEIMYHPAGEDEAEFLELTNVGEVPAGLTGAFLEGVDFRFADGAQLAAGESLVLVRDLDRFRSRYPEAEVHGIYGGRLSDRGERIALMARDGATLFSVHYDDRNGWPLSADGAGDSIVLEPRAGDPENPASWRASRFLHGSPGEFENGR